MSPNQTVEYTQAAYHVERKIRFYIHLSVYTIVVTSLLMLNQTPRSSHGWPFFPLLFWGIALAVHGLKVYLRVPGARLKRHMIEQELRKQA